MTSTKRYPTVLLVGRTNVGKSTLFNRLTDKTKSLVYDRPGVTRDYIQEVVTWNTTAFELIDTGGLIPQKKVETLQHEVTRSVKKLLEHADLILFVVDVKSGLLDHDTLLARLIHRHKKPTILIVNKVDNKKYFEEHYFDFFSLGFEKICPISASHGLGITQLMETVLEYLPHTPHKEEIESQYKVAIIGKPNVGKSSLMNLLVKKDRALVSDEAGTTREAITEHLTFFKTALELTDTAGIRRKKKVTDDLEQLMVKSAFHAIDNADIILLVIDASHEALTDQELKLLFYAHDNKKAVIVLFNKIDLVALEQKEKLLHDLQRYDFIFNKVEILWISCLTKKNIHKVLHALQKIWELLHQQFNSTELNDLVQQYLMKKPLFHKRQQLKVFKIRHVKARTPTFVLHVNHPEWFQESQRGFIENIIRKHYNLKGCPVTLITRKV